MTWIPKGNLRGRDGYNATNAAEDDAALAAFVTAPTTPTATNAAVVDVIAATDDHPGSATLASLPNVLRKVAGYNDATGTPLVVASVGTSVGVGATLPDAVTQAPGADFKTKLAAVINRLGNVTISHHNGAVNGSVETELLTQYTAVKTALGAPPAALYIVQGMNGGMVYHYHSGQTFGGVYTGLKAVVEAALSDGVDVTIATTPHPHTVRTPWTAPASWGYPQASPAALVPAAGYDASVVDVVSASGKTVPASYRHLRVNDTARRVAAEYGVALVDAERYWFDAVAEHGEDPLFNGAEYAHPNLLGHQLSYGKANAAFARAVSRPAVVAGAPRPPLNLSRRKVNNSTRPDTTMATDSQLSFYAGANSVWEIDVDLFYTTPTAQDIRVGWELPAGATGRHGIAGASVTATTFGGSEGVFRSFPVANAMAMGGNGSDCWGRVRAVVQVGATGGTIGVQYAADVAGGTCTLLQHSTLRARQIS